jgi:DNA-binding GntR family transcriptional regulator
VTPPASRESGGATLDRRRAIERVYTAIREGILTGEFSSGEHLREEALAQRASTSRTPVREALRRLEADGLVTIGENRRSYVSDFAPNEIQAIYEIRVRLESYAAELACANLDHAGLDQLYAINDRIVALGPEVSNVSLRRFMDLNSEFHLCLVHMSRSRQLEAALSSAILVPLVLLKHYVWGDTVRIERSHRQHREIIEALKSGNRHWVSACVASHIQSSRPQIAFETFVPD